MKNLNWLNKGMFVLNIVLTVLTFAAYILPFLAPKLFPLLSVLTLFLPLMLILNLIFFFYWLIQFKKQLFVSGLILLLGITFINKYYRLSATDLPKTDKDFVVMSYNVRLFNLYNWIDKTNLSEEISDFITALPKDKKFISKIEKVKIKITQIITFNLAGNSLYLKLLF